MALWPNCSAAPNGKRNETLNAMAFRLGRMIARGWVDEKAVVETLLGACEANNYLREHGHRATKKTIESGIEAGKKEPHPDLAAIRRCALPALPALPGSRARRQSEGRPEGGNGHLGRARRHASR